MMNRPIEGMILSATKRSGAFGQCAFDDVVLRGRDGRERMLGGVMVSVRLADALAPGSEGYFCFHDLLGARGLHAHQGAGEPARLVFPMLVERAFALLALLNLGLVAGGMAADGGLQLVPLMLGILATAAWGTCRAGREAVIHDFREEQRLRTPRSRAGQLRRAPATSL